MSTSWLALSLFIASVAICVALPFSSDPLQVHFKFDDAQGSNTFTDSSVYKRHGSCGSSGKACPRSGSLGSISKAAYFAASCTRSYGTGNWATDHAEFIKSAATCGSRVDFPAVQIQDGTVMVWFKETGSNDGNPAAISQSEAPAVVNIRKPNDLGWDLSFAGGESFSIGRLSNNLWGGHWCGQWYVGKSTHATVGDSSNGWDHLAWHHFAVVFSGSTAMVYIDGTLVKMFRNTGECQKQISFLGERTVRYTQQNGLRDTEMSGLLEDRPRATDSVGTYLNVLAHSEWSTNLYKGLLDDFRVYDKVMSQAEIAAAMAA